MLQYFISLRQTTAAIVRMDWPKIKRCCIFHWPCACVWIVMSQFHLFLFGLSPELWNPLQEGTRGGGDNLRGLCRVRWTCLSSRHEGRYKNDDAFTSSLLAEFLSPCHWIHMIFKRVQLETFSIMPRWLFSDRLRLLKRRRGPICYLQSNYPVRQ